jgi:hypothetical protein
VNIGEANDVNVVLTFLTGRHSTVCEGFALPSADEFRAAAERLAGRAYRVLMAGWTADRLQAVMAGAELHPAAVDRKVPGYCPMGCGESLVWRMGGLTCSYRGCARPTAVGELLADDRTDHLVDVQAGTFAVRHPLSERIDDDLFACDLHEYMAGLAGPPVPPGRYYAVRVGDGWVWEATAGTPGGGQRA